SQNIIKLESVKYNANQNPLKIGRTLAISTIPFTSDFKSLKKLFAPCFLKSFSILNSVFVYILKCTHLLSCLIICIACKRSGLKLFIIVLSYYTTICSLTLFINMTDFKRFNALYRFVDKNLSFAT